MTQSIVPDISTDEQSQFKQNLSIQAALRALNGSREVLTANRSYYVSTSGSDPNNGLSSSTPFKNIQKAIDTACDLDFNNKTVAINLTTAGTYAGFVLNRTWAGGGTLTVSGIDATTIIDGNTVTTWLNGAAVAGTNLVHAAAYTAPLSGFATVSNCKLISTTGYGISHQTVGRVTVGAGVTFGACGNCHVATQVVGASVFATSSYTISGAANSHMLAVTQGQVQYGTGMTVTLSGSPVFSQGFFNAQQGSLILCRNPGSSVTFSGSAGAGTPRVNVQGAIVDLNGAGSLSSIPGNSNYFGGALGPGGYVF